MSQTQIARLVAEALAAIDADLPEYVEPLHQLRTLPGALGALEAEPSLASTLFAELRKLRPFPLWVRDEPRRALALKQVGVFDGAICRPRASGGEPAPWPAAAGRECWWEVEAAQAERLLRELPPGWGLIVRGELSRQGWAGLRKLSPLRALGAALDGPGVGHLSPVPSDIRLDLVTLDEARSQLVELGARALWSIPESGLVELTQRSLSLAALAPSSGLLCHGDDALACALWFATVRAPRRSSVPAR